MTESIIPPDAYFAGHFDGEGCINMATHSRGDKRPILRLDVTATYLPILHLYKKRFKGDVYKSFAGKNKPQYRWRCSRRTECLEFMRAIVPYANEKREQLELAISWLEYRGTRPEYDRAQETTVRALETARQLKELRSFSYPFAP